MGHGVMGWSVQVAAMHSPPNASVGGVGASPVSYVGDQHADRETPTRSSGQGASYWVPSQSGNGQDVQYHASSWQAWGGHQGVGPGYGSPGQQGLSAPRDSRGPGSMDGASSTGASPHSGYGSPGAPMHPSYHLPPMQGSPHPSQAPNYSSGQPSPGPTAAAGGYSPGGYSSGGYSPGSAWASPAPDASPGPHGRGHAIWAERSGAVGDSVLMSSNQDMAGASAGLDLDSNGISTFRRTSRGGELRLHHRGSTPPLIFKAERCC